MDPRTMYVIQSYRGLFLSFLWVLFFVLETNQLGNDLDNRPSIKLKS